MLASIIVMTFGAGMFVGSFFATYEEWEMDSITAYSRIFGIVLTLGGLGGMVLIHWVK